MACSFWMVHALVSTHQIGRAAALMDRSVALASDLGLLSEQIDAEDGTFLGNFPQALSHLALVNAACALADAAPDDS